MLETLVPLCHCTRRHFTDHSKRHPTSPLQELTLALISLSPYIITMEIPSTFETSGAYQSTQRRLSEDFNVKRRSQSVNAV